MFRHQDIRCQEKYFLAPRQEYRVLFAAMKEHFLPLGFVVFLKIIFVAGWITPIKYSRLHPNHV